MQAFFWGTRGSLPVSMTAVQVRRKITKAVLAMQGRSFATEEDVGHCIDEQMSFADRATYGGNTSCIEIRGTDDYILCDAGTGLRDFGNSLAPYTKPAVFHLFLSHLHWDHLQGFPFFTPAFIPGNRIHIYGCHADLEQAFREQQKAPFFPVPFNAMRADISFTILQPETSYDIAGLTVQCLRQNHPGDSYGYAFCGDGKRIVYSTDSEHKRDAESPFYPFLEFIHEADLLIFDAQYTLLDAMGGKENWGHSSNIVAVELAVEGQVKRLCMFHNEHSFDDAKLDQFLADTREYLKIHAPDSLLDIQLAYDGLTISV